jgi:hypothetical protein
MVRLSYPLRERTEKVKLGRRSSGDTLEYEIAWRGNTVVGVSPTGERAGLYRRAGALGGTQHAPPAVGCVPSREPDL